MVSVQTCIRVRVCELANERVNESDIPMSPVHLKSRYLSGGTESGSHVYAMIKQIVSPSVDLISSTTIDVYLP